MRLSDVPRARDARVLAASVAVVALLIPAAVSADARLFRPLTADPRENQTHWRLMSEVQDHRYGTDITDSTSHGGVDRNVRGNSWEASAGETFRWRPLRRIGAVSMPFRRYQLGFAAGVFSRFDGYGSLLNNDYQFGGVVDLLWRGDYDDDRGITSFARTVITSRFMLFHRSSHLGDEYLSMGRFGRNQEGYGVGGLPFTRPPVKRVDLSGEYASFVLSLERRVGDTPATVRAYGGGEWALTLPWGIGGRIPANFTSPAARVGLEARSGEDAEAAPEGLVARALNGALGGPWTASEWIAAIDLRLARPYNFAAADNPNGETEVWTPRLWTTSRYGREFRHYAGSWHALIGSSVRAIHERARTPNPRVGSEWIVALEWYRGYSPDGQFLDQRLRDRPRLYVIPSLTAHF